jgi:LPS-assembly lipoprotein
MLRPILLFISFLCLAGCGFHLRGEVNLAPSLHNLYIKTADPYGQLAKNLRQYFKQSGINVTDNAKEAITIFDILSEQESQQTLSISGTQLTRQYNLALTVIFQVSDQSGKTIIPPQIVTESRAITIQANQILAGSNELTNLYQQMRRAIVFKIINRLASRDITARLNESSTAVRRGT